VDEVFVGLSSQDGMVGFEVQYPLIDALGSVYREVGATLSELSRYSYDVYGTRDTTRAFSGLGVFGYTGREHEMNALFVYFRTRYLLSNAGEFVGPDLVRHQPGFGGRYGLGYATARTDPSGMTAVVEGLAVGAVMFQLRRVDSVSGFVVSSLIRIFAIIAASAGTAYAAAAAAREWSKMVATLELLYGAVAVGGVIMSSSDDGDETIIEIPVPPPPDIPSPFDPDPGRQFRLCLLGCSRLCGAVRRMVCRIGCVFLVLPG